VAIDISALAIRATQKIRAVLWEQGRSWDDRTTIDQVAEIMADNEFGPASLATARARLPRPAANSVRCMLDLSAEHIQPFRTESGELLLVNDIAKVDFGGLRSISHEHGYTVFVYGGLDEDEERALVPEWLRPIHTLALKYECLIINFDHDGEIFDDLGIYNWIPKA